MRDAIVLRGSAHTRLINTHIHTHTKQTDSVFGQWTHTDKITRVSEWWRGSSPLNIYFHYNHNSYA